MSHKQFIERLSTYTPEQIVEEYGTHVLKDIYLGAKFEVYYMAKSTSSSKKKYKRWVRRFTL